MLENKSIKIFDVLTEFFEMMYPNLWDFPNEDNKIFDPEYEPSDDEEEFNEIGYNYESDGDEEIEKLLDPDYVPSDEDISGEDASNDDASNDDASNDDASNNDATDYNDLPDLVEINEDNSKTIDENFNPDYAPSEEEIVDEEKEKKLDPDYDPSDDKE